MVHFLAHSGMFRSSRKAAFLRGAGVIPVYRRTDESDARERNVATFQACYEVLEQGGVIGIFPEGTSQEERRVQRFKTGTARIALEAEERNRFELGVAVVPVGINFESRGRFRSRVLLSLGDPIRTWAYQEEYEREPQNAVSRFTEELQVRITQLVVNIERSELDDLVQDIESVYKGELLEMIEERTGDSSLSRELGLSREIARAVEFFYDVDPELVWRVAHLLKEYRRKRERLRLSDEELRTEGVPSLRGALTRLGALGILGLPVAAWGVLWNWLPYRATGWAASRLATDTTKLHWHHLSLGALFYAVYYPLLLFLAHGILGTVGTLIFAVSLVPSGLFARAFAREIARRRGALWLAYLAATKEVYVQELKNLRRRIIALMDRAREEYLAYDGGPESGPAPPSGQRS